MKKPTIYILLNFIILQNIFKVIELSWIIKEFYIKHYI